jgi:hypothetical protein
MKMITKRICRAAIVCLLALVAAPSARATPIELPVVTGSSNINVQLCILGNCSNDNSRVAGFAKVKIAPFSPPTLLTLYDFNFALLDQIDLHNHFVFPPGDFVGTGQNIDNFDASPGIAQPPTAVAGNGSFTYANVPTNSSGTISYTSTGFICTAFQSQTPPQPCNNVINLADQGTSNDTYTGVVTVGPNRLLTITFTLNSSQPIDPNNPGFGTFTTTGTVLTQTVVPLRGDANQDGQLDARDIAAFTQVLLNPPAATWQQRFSVDMNDDDAFDQADVDSFTDCLLNGNCGN